MKNQAARLGGDMSRSYYRWLDCVHPYRVYTHGHSRMPLFKYDYYPAHGLRPILL